MIIDILDSELRGIDEKIKIYSKYTNIYSWIIYISLGFSFLVTTLAGSVNLSQISDKSEVKIAWSIVLWINSVLCGLVAYTRPILERHNIILKKYKIVQKYLNMFKTSNTVTRDALVNIIKLLDETDSEAFSFNISDIQNPDINVSVPLNRNNINYITNVIDRLTPRKIKRKSAAGQTVPIQDIIIQEVTTAESLAVQTSKSLAIHTAETTNDITESPISTPETELRTCGLNEDIKIQKPPPRIIIPKLTWKIVDAAPYEPQPLTPAQIEQVRANIEPVVSFAIQPVNTQQNTSAQPRIDKQPSKVMKINKTIERLLLMRNETYNFINTMPIVYSVSGSNSTNTSVSSVTPPNPTPETANILHEHSISTQVLHNESNTPPELRSTSNSLSSNSDLAASFSMSISEHVVGNIPAELATSPIAEAIKTLESTIELNTPDGLLTCNIHLDPNDPQY